MTVQPNLVGDPANEIPDDAGNDDEKVHAVPVALQEISAIHIDSRNTLKCVDGEKDGVQHSAYERCHDAFLDP